MEGLKVKKIKLKDKNAFKPNLFFNAIISLSANVC